MQVDTIGRPEQLSNVQPGECIFFDSSNGMRFGMLTKDGNQKGFLVFAKSDDGRAPWVITGGLPQNVLVVDKVQIRADWTSAAISAASQIGEITSAAGNFYMRAALRKMETVSINLASGLLDDPPSLGPIFHYARWSAGLVRDGKWLSLVEFPFTKGSV
ncbi:hypothetical protein D6B98_36485 [Bradyrhizobium sp. LVM 105]|uniref:Uncharacterized protein n=2 Tax=Nitrobacteraceae TaxID=41294 RepID=A0A4Y9KSY4_9BRAD|nr:hypothetical protein D6B98_36485 [Bradyrhizobium sp. LVM 105]TFV30334.1 hypothetical protein E4K66_35695 [Bradyrhizobium frederickii]TFV70209.1 hypothetical protein E4K64_30590 [Bradyrhizobium frederickii]